MRNRKGPTLFPYFRNNRRNVNSDHLKTKKENMRNRGILNYRYKFQMTKTTFTLLFLIILIGGIVIPVLLFYTHIEKKPKFNDKCQEAIWNESHMSYRDERILQAIVMYDRYKNEY